VRKKNSPKKLGRGWTLPANALSDGLREFLDWSEVHAISPRTIRQRQRAIRRFILWAEDRGITRPADVTLPVLERYQRHLFTYRKPTGEPLTFGSQAAEVIPLRAFFKWLVRARLILYNPAAELMMPKVTPRLSRYVLTVADIEAIINATEATTLLGVRDRAILEVLYSSAIRRSELMNLRIYDVDTRRGSVFVKSGKGDKDRLVPLGERACAWVDKYLLDVRPALATGGGQETLFLTQYGDKFDDYTIGELVKRFIAKAGIAVKGACHLFRHACATHMLENGADTRYIQAMLGHSQLSTTQIYTHVALAKLKEIHTATHPARSARSSAASTAKADAP
jgi:integrase/recombinase XerD